MLILTIPKKFWVLAICAGAVFAVILLSASLSNLEFRAGNRNFTLRELPRLNLSEDSKHESTTYNPLQVFFAIMFGFVAPLVIVASLTSKKYRKRILISICFILLMTLLYLIVTKIEPKGVSLRPKPLGLDEEMGMQQSEQEEPYIPPGWLKWLVYPVSLLLIVGLFLLIMQFKQGRRSSPLELVAEEAQKTIEDLNAGADLKEGVIRCYFEMSRVMKEEHDLKRKHAMTTREFETYLKEAGFLSEDVSSLSRLFEKVRYGAKRPDKEEEQEAVVCLSAIVKTCKRLS